MRGRQSRQKEGVLSPDHHPDDPGESPGINVGNYTVMRVLYTACSEFPRTLPAGCDIDKFENDVWMTYLLDKDPIGEGKLVYCQEITAPTMSERGVHVVHINCAYALTVDFTNPPPPENGMAPEDWLELLKWAHDFVTKDENDMLIPAMAQLKRAAITEDEKGGSPLKATVYDVVREYGDVRKAEGRAEGLAEGEAKVAKTKKETAIKCIRKGLSDVDTSEVAALPLEEVQRIRSQLASA